MESYILFLQKKTQRPNSANAFCSILNSLPLNPGCMGLTLSTGPEVAVRTTPRVPDPTYSVEAGDGTGEEMVPFRESNAELLEVTGHWGPRCIAMAGSWALHPAGAGE